MSSQTNMQRLAEQMQPISTNPDMILAPNGFF